jgi:hypothetical protein
MEEMKSPGVEAPGILLDFFGKRPVCFGRLDTLPGMGK